MLAIRLPAEIEKRLEKLAKRTARTKSFYVREAILEHLDALENGYRVPTPHRLQKEMVHMRSRAAAKPPLRSPEGLLEDLDLHITEEDIAQARREMWGNFPRDIS